MRILDAIDTLQKGGIKIAKVTIVITNSESNGWQSLEWEGEADFIQMQQLRLKIYNMSYSPRTSSLHLQGSSEDNNMKFEEMKKKFDNMNFIDD